MILFKDGVEILDDVFGDEVIIGVEDLVFGVELFVNDMLVDKMGFVVDLLVDNGGVEFVLVVIVIIVVLLMIVVVELIKG